MRSKMTGREWTITQPALADKPGGNQIVSTCFMNQRPSSRALSGIRHKRGANTPGFAHHGRQHHVKMQRPWSSFLGQLSMPCSNSTGNKPAHNLR